MLLFRLLRSAFLAAIAVGMVVPAMAQVEFVADTSAVQFFSRTSIENIEAINHKSTSTLIPSEYSVQFQIPIIGFKFENGLMQKHFNSMYMETDKYPFATFRGKLSDSLDLSKDTVYLIKATGIMKIHGIDHAGVFDGRIESKKGRAKLWCAFKVKLDDHGIKIPGATFLNIAKEIEVKVYFEYYRKPEKVGGN